MNLLQRPITNKILHYITCNLVQNCWIEQVFMIFPGINMNIENEIYSPTPPLFSFPKVTHMIEQHLLCMIIIFKSLFGKVRGFPLI